jgi:lipoate-protein ligase B
MKELAVIDLGITSYRRAWEVQRRIFASRAAGEAGDTLLFTEHRHVYTFGAGSDKNHLLANSEELGAKSIDVVETDRGGDITYHGPGQIVGYPILDLHGFYPDLHRYLRDLEEVLIRALGDFGIHASRNDGYTGVWTGGEKIAAIGVKASHWVTMHGFALNVNTDLSFFDRIIPCGIFHRGVTSMEKVLGQSISLEDVRTALVRRFEDVFGVTAQKPFHEENRIYHSA